MRPGNISRESPYCRSVRGSWPMFRVLGFWVLGSWFWVSGGLWVLGFGFWLLGFRFLVLDFGFYVLGFGCWVFALMKRLGSSSHQRIVTVRFHKQLISTSLEQIKSSLQNSIRPDSWQAANLPFPYHGWRCATTRSRPSSPSAYAPSQNSPLSLCWYSRHPPGGNPDQLTPEPNHPPRGCPNQLTP
jgi:hypothetical protein